MEVDQETFRTTEPFKRTVRRPRTHSKYPLPSERFPFETHFEILRQFAVRTKQGAEPVGTAAVEGGAVPKQAAALNVRFLTSLGLLKEDEKAKGKYAPTPTAVKFVTVRNASEEKARPILRSIVESSWFGEFAKNVFATRAVIPEDEFVRDLAIYAEVSDMTKKEPALRTVTAYLTYTGLVTKAGNGNLTLGTSAAAEAGAVSTPTPAVPASAEVRAAPEAGAYVSADWHVIQTEDFYVKVRSDVDVMADLRAYLDLLERKVARLQARREPSPNEKAAGEMTP